MLLIGDIHITSKIKSELLAQLRTFFAQQKDEKNLIFMGDFVYHFSYDRGALLELFELFLDLYREGRNVYILAGNHDWLGNSFVFEEGKKVFDLLQKGDQHGKLFFITEPWLTEIEGEKIFFLPFCLDFDERKYPAYQLGSNVLTQALLQSKDKNEVFSGRINQLVNGVLQQEKSLTLIHHYYVNKEQFPGYRSSFAFKDIALSDQLLDAAGLKMISGHLHAPFVYKNYLCTGSVWATSPLESNQLKGVWKYNDGKLDFYALQMINYFQLESQKPLVEQDIRDLYAACSEQLEKQLKNQTFFSFGKFATSELDLKKTVLNLKVEKLDYEKVDEVISDELRSQLSDFRLKKSTQKVDDLLQKLQKPNEDALQTFGGWKELLKNYLQAQYGEEYPQYEQLLRDLKVL